ncbi:hypothetical protein TI05_05920 [Achromatium sp. WMS3]|nr:hypothetical protein TI05_05920 [Achromatium sp. WMS3]
MCVVGIVGGVVGVVAVGALAHGDYSDYHHRDYSDHSDYSDAAEKERRRRKLLRQEFENLKSQLAQDVVNDMSWFQSQNDLPAHFGQEVQRLATVIRNNEGDDDMSLNKLPQSLVGIVENHCNHQVKFELAEKRQQLERVDALIKRVNEIRLEN